MKKIFYAMFALAIGGLFFTSCDNDDEEYSIFQVVGDFIPETDHQRVIMDDCDTLLITNKEKLSNVDYTRIMMLVEIISEKKTGEFNLYEVRLVDYQKVLTKEPILTSFIAEDETHRRDSIGNDYISIYKADIEASYLNVIYTLNIGDSKVAHFINLVIDDSEELKVENGELILNAELHHNAYNDLAIYGTKGYVSFKMEKYINMPGVNKILMNIKNGEDNIKIVKWESNLPVPTPLKLSNILGIDYMQSIN